MNVFAEFIATIVVSVGVSILTYVVTRHYLSNDKNEQFIFDAVQPIVARWSDRIQFVLFLGYVLVFGALALLRYFSFHTGYLGVSTAWDLGQYSQLIWNSLNGRLMEGSFVADTRTFLGKTFTPILLAFVPLYAVLPSPIVLIVVQTIGLGLGAFPIYWLARARVGHLLALGVTLAYFLSPGLENIGLTEFHEIALAVPLLAYATFFLLRRHYGGFFVSLGVALLIKEEIALGAVVFGAYIFLVQRKSKLGLALGVLGALWLLLLLQFLIPFFRGSEYGSTFYYFGQGAIGGGGARYNYLGRSVPEILTTLLTRPDYVWQYVWIPEKVEYVLHLLVPLAFVPCVGIEVFALAFPAFGYSLLSTYGLQYSIRSYYFAPLLPLLFFATIVGLRRLLDWGARISRCGEHPLALKVALALLLLSASGITYFLQSPGPFGGDFQAYRYVLNEHTALGSALMDTIPSDAIVVGQNEFLAHLSNRRWLYEIPMIPDYRQADFLVADTTPRSWYYVHEGHWDWTLATGYFEIVTNQDNYLIARRKPPDYARSIRFGDEITFLGYSLVLTGTLQGGMKFQPIASWRADKPIAERYKIAIQIVDAQGHLWAEEVREPDGGFSPTNQWRPGRSVGDQYTLSLPPTMPTGDYRITVGARSVENDKELPATDEQGNALGTQPVIGSVRIEKNKNSFLASELWWIEQPLYVDMREMRFLGFALPRNTIHPGALLSVGLYWRARGKPQGDYLVVVQLRDAGGRVVFERASRPAQNTYLTTQWDAGEVLLDWHDLSLPDSIPEGEYQLLVLMRDAGTGQTVGETPIAPVTIHH